MKNLAKEIKGDKSLWERMIVPNVGKVLLVEDSYYDGIVEDVEKQQQEIELLTNLKNTLEEANRGMSAKLDEQREKIEILNGTVIRKNAEIVVLMDSYQGKGS